MEVTIPSKEPLIMHGKCSFMKQEKVAKLLREGGGASLETTCSLCFSAVGVTPSSNRM